MARRARGRSTSALPITYNRLYIILFTFACSLLLLVVLKRTRLGLEVRAVVAEPRHGPCHGHPHQWVDAMTFGLGSGIAGIAGVALSQLTNVGPNLGQSYIVDSFMVVVFGGVGNLWGTQIGGNALGIINKVLEPYAGAVLAKIFVLVFLILFIQRRPRGLFPQKGRAAEADVMDMASRLPSQRLMAAIQADRGGRIFLALLLRWPCLVLLLNLLVPAVLGSASVHLHRDAARQVHVLRHARHGGGSDLGLSAAS